MDAIDRIHEFERFGSRLGLERMSALMDILGNPQDELKYIHIAGTNGKGSVSRYIYEALRSNGYKVGLYTSPFLEIFNERIEFDGSYIEDDELATITAKVLEAVDKMLAKGLDSPTEFEVTTAIAFLYFCEKKADFVVLEVGLGGRGDSTNIIKNPLITVITSISYDHTDRLGTTLAEIASEKAGIIKEGVPVIMNVKEREAKVPIARKAYEKNTLLYDITKIKKTCTEQTLDATKFDTMIYGTDYSEVEISMLGDHQIDNAMTALATLEVLRKAREIKVERTKLYEGLKKAKQIGRFEIVKKDPLVILDGAHNPDGAEALRKAADKYLQDMKILFVAGMLADKDVDKIIEHFSEISTDFVITKPNNPRSLDEEALCEHIQKRGKRCLFKGSPTEACDFVQKNKEGYQAILFAGSLYLIGEIRGIIKKWKD